ncbi:hypothetical protein UNDYM_1576 [Undibacterium sp. YM2]|nr:hypothetical protein UNDYM_1576 [Undibacterium sp. YM2]
MEADTSRNEQLQQVSELSLSTAHFAQFLQKEIYEGASLNKAMRRLRKLVVCTLIKRDLCSQADLNEVITTISLFADFVVQQHLQALNAEMQAMHGTPIGEESGKQQAMIVLGMGKLGGYELNVSSDIDLIFCYAEDGETQTTDSSQRSLSNHEYFSRLGKKLIAAISEVTEDGYSFRVDMALRPNGASGPLVASFNMIEEYFLIQGREWERYAWVKARAMTGNDYDIAALEKSSALSSIVVILIMARLIPCAPCMPRYGQKSCARKPNIQSAAITSSLDVVAYERWNFWHRFSN